MAGSGAPGTKGEISVIATRELIAVEAKENVPDEIARVWIMYSESVMLV